MQSVKGCAYRGTGSLESEDLSLGFCIRETRATVDFSVNLREGNLGGYRLEAPAWLQLRLLPLANDLRDPQIQTVGVSQMPLLRILCDVCSLHGNSTETRRDYRQTNKCSCKSLTLWSWNPPQYTHFFEQATVLTLGQIWVGQGIMLLDADYRFRCEETGQV